MLINIQFLRLALNNLLCLICITYYYVMLPCNIVDVVCYIGSTVVGAPPEHVPGSLPTMPQMSYKKRHANSMELCIPYGEYAIVPSTVQVCSRSGLAVSHMERTLPFQSVTFPPISIHVVNNSIVHRGHLAVYSLPRPLCTVFVFYCDGSNRKSDALIER